MTAVRLKLMCSHNRGIRKFVLIMATACQRGGLERASALNGKSFQCSVGGRRVASGLVCAGKRAAASVAALGDNAADEGSGMQEPDISLSEVRVVKKVASGEFGDVFEATLERGASTEPVVLKQFRKPWFKGRDVDSFYNSELSMLRLIAKRKCEGVPAFKGVVGGDVYLAWANEGLTTLAAATDSKDAPSKLAELMNENSAERALKNATSSLLQSVDSLHKQFVVHRDIKPSNVIVVGSQKLKLIDVGGSCDIRDGVNYDPGEAILDGEYGSPEMYVDAEETGIPSGRRLWNAARPDLFDAFSIGLVVFQLAVPSFNGRRGMKRLRKQLARRENGQSLARWRENNEDKLRAEDFALLDASNGKGWDFVSKLVCPRKFASAENKERMSVKEAMRYGVYCSIIVSTTHECSASPSGGSHAYCRHPFVRPGFF